MVLLVVQELKKIAGKAMKIKTVVAVFINPFVFSHVSE
jgi:hypothetical protein